jgi:integrase
MPYKRTNSPYWWISYQEPGGKRAGRSTGLPNTREYQAKAKKLEAEARLEAGKLKRGEFDGLTFDQATLEWLDNGLNCNGSKRKDNTSAVHRLKKLTPVFTGKPIIEIKRPDVIRYRNARLADGAKPGTVNREINVLGSIITQAIDAYGLEMLNPTSRTRLSEKDSAKTRYLTRAEYHRLIAACGENHILKSFITLSVQFGFRLNEALKLEWARVDLDANKIYLFNEDQKNGDTTGMTITPVAREVFIELKQTAGSSPYVFTRANGKRAENITHGFKNACHRAGLENVTPHTLRHTTGSWLAQDGHSAREIMEYMRHSDIKTSQRYMHLAPDNIEQCAKSLAV